MNAMFKLGLFRSKAAAAPANDYRVRTNAEAFVNQVDILKKHMPSSFMYPTTEKAIQELVDGGSLGEIGYYGPHRRRPGGTSMSWTCPRCLAPKDADSKPWIRNVLRTSCRSCGTPLVVEREISHYVCDPDIKTRDDCGGRIA